MEPKSVELHKPQVIEILNKVGAYRGKPPQRVVPRKIVERMAEVAEWDDKIKGFTEPEEARAMRSQLQELDAARQDKEKPPAERAPAEAEFQKLLAEFNKLINDWLAIPVFVPWDRAERRWIWELFRKEYDGECTLTREDAIIKIGTALGKAGEIEDMIAEAIEASEEEEEEDGDKEKPAAQLPKPALVQ